MNRLMDYIKYLRRLWTNTPQCVKVLINMLNTLPDIISIKEHRGKLSLIYNRKLLAQSFTDIKLVSWERGLRTSGFKLTQSTHGGFETKIWSLPEKCKKKTYKNPMLPLRDTQKSIRDTNSVQSESEDTFSIDEIIQNIKAGTLCENINFDVNKPLYMSFDM